MPQRPSRPRAVLLLALAALVGAPAGAAAAPGGAEAGAATSSRGAPSGSSGARAGASTAAPRPAATAAVQRRALVAAVQRRLHVPADGALGPRTRAAVRRFQRRRGLRPTGRLDARTLAALGVAPKAATAPALDAAAVLTAIAACESGGDPTRVSADGAYRGKYQFDSGTWAALGGRGDPAAAPEAEQDQRAAALYAREGAGPWPVCGRRATAAR